MIQSRADVIVTSPPILVRTLVQTVGAMEALNAMLILALYVCCCDPCVLFQRLIALYGIGGSTSYCR